MIGGDGEIVGGVAVMRDMGAMEELEELKEDFIAMVSHELRTPLTNLSAAIQLLLKESEEDSDRQSDLLKVVWEQSMRLGSFVDKILEAAELTAGRVQVMQEPVTMVPLVRRVVGNWQAGATRHRFVIEVIGKGPYLAVGDVGKVDIVLNNLVENAVKYSPNGGRVIVTVREENSEIVVSVEDEGIGIPEGERERVFDWFYRVERGDARETYGYGLGLYIARRLVELMGGRIWVESQVGKGSRFYFSLPKLANGQALA